MSANNAVKDAVTSELPQWLVAYTIYYKDTSPPDRGVLCRGTREECIEYAEHVDFKPSMARNRNPTECRIAVYHVLDYPSYD